MRIQTIFIIIIISAFFIIGCNSKYATKEELYDLSTNWCNSEHATKEELHNLSMNVSKIEGDIKKAEETYLKNVGEIVDSTFFIQRTTNQGTNLGTGFILDGEGYVVTATHVVGNTSPENIKLSLVDNDFRSKEHIVEKVYPFPSIYDLSILKINLLNSFETQKIADEEDVKIGSEVLFIGFQQPDKESPFIVKLMGEGVISGYLPFNAGDHIDRLYIIKGVSLPGGSGGPVFLKSGKGIIGFSTAIDETPEMLSAKGEIVKSQWWLIYVVPLHNLKERFEDFKKNVSED